MTADRRVTAAREYLDGARRRKVDSLPPSVLMRELAETRRQLGQVLDAIDQADDEDGTEAYCTTCGEWAGMFLGMDGWHHYRGDPAPGGERILYEADHKLVIRWVRPPGLALSPGGLKTLALMLADAISCREPSGACTGCEDHPAGLCEPHAADLDQTDTYLAIGRQLGIEVPQ